MHRMMNLSIYIFKTQVLKLVYFYTASFSVNMLFSFIPCIHLTLGFILIPFSFEKTTSESSHPVKAGSGLMWETIVRWVIFC